MAKPEPGAGLTAALAEAGSAPQQRPSAVSVKFGASVEEDLVQYCKCVLKAMSAHCNVLCFAFLFLFHWEGT